MSAVAQSVVAVGLELAVRQASASRRLHDALVAGHSTAEIRRELAELERQVTRLAADQAEQAAAEEAQMAERIAAATEEFVSYARTRLDTLMANLAIPPAPSKGPA